MKFRHILLLLLAALTIAFMQPLVTFLGGLTLLLGVGGIILRDLPPASQEAVEHRVLGWLRRMRTGSAPMLRNQVKANEHLTVDSVTTPIVTESPRRTRSKASSPLRSSPAPTEAKSHVVTGKSSGTNL